MVRLRQTILLFITLLSSVLAADVVEFNNGDRLQGSVVSMQEGSLVLNSPLLGELTIPMAEIKSFSTDKSTELHLKDGSVLHQRVNAAAPGRVNLEGSSLLKGQSLSMADITLINPAVPDPVTWDGNVAIGIAVQTGNSESQDASVDISAKRETEFDRILLDMDYVENREENINTGVKNTSKRYYALGTHYDYFLTPKYYVYADAQAEKESTANIDLRLTIGGGGGYRWIDTATTAFDVEAGLSWVNETFSDATEDGQYLALRTAWRYSRQLTESLRFFHNGQWFPSLENTDDQLVKTETGIRSVLSGSLFIDAKLLYDWDNTPADGKEKEDATYIIGVGWNF